MQAALEIMNAITWQIVVFVLVVAAFIVACLIAILVAAASRRHDKIKHKEVVEQRRIDAARSIVPLRPHHTDEG